VESLSITMLARTAFQILRHEKAKYAGVVVGITMALFLVLLQFGFYLGFRRDITVVPDSFDAELWISQRSLLSFDYPTHFDDLPRWETLQDVDVEAASGIIADWIRFRRMSDGATESAVVVGIDFSEGVAADLGTDSSVDLLPILSVPGSVLVDEKHVERVGKVSTGEVGIEIRGLHANIVGVMKGKKLFSTACLLVTDLDNARRFLNLPANRISFIAVKCRAGADIQIVKSRLQWRLPEYHVWTAPEFHDLTQNYWVKLTGIGPVLLLSAGLAALVGFLTVFLTFSHLTSEKLPVYAAMKAMGASNGELAGIVILQIGVVFGIGSLLAVMCVGLALVALSTTTISVVLTPGIALLGVGFMGVCSLAAGWKSLRTLSKIEPAEAFRV
jgi:putative ABC transport system permease protein